MDTTNLRKLSFKSTMKFGKYSDITVQNIIDLYNIKGLSYLTWCYYNLQKISFLPEVLEVLGIEKDLQITKPGKLETKEEFRFINQKVIKVRQEKEDLEQTRAKEGMARAIIKQDDTARKSKRKAQHFKETNSDRQRRFNQGHNTKK